MATSKIEDVTFDRETLVQALGPNAAGVDPDTLNRMIDAMAEAARRVLEAEGIELRFESSRGGQSGNRMSGAHRGGRRRNTAVIRGQGLSEPLGPDEGLAHLRARSVILPIEQWAGRVLGPKMAAAELHVTRSTVDNWRKQGEIIALPKGKAAHVIPMAQFHDGRPLAGIGRVLEIADGSARLAWGWLMTPHIDFDDGNPLEALSAGRAGEVFEAAERSIG